MNDEEWLWYKPQTINVGIIRGTTADQNGNISMEGEIGTGEALAIAEAAHACGGIVIAQVKQVAIQGTLDPKAMAIPPEAEPVIPANVVTLIASDTSGVPPI